MAQAKESKNRPFTKDYDPNPHLETVEVTEEILIEYIQETARKASRMSTRRQKLYPEDLLFVLRKDRKKFTRARELLKMNEEIKQARKSFDQDQYTK